jgi:protein O-GlcNAc transferase
MSHPSDTRGTELPRAIEFAAECYEDGRLEEALAACESHLATHPGHFDATHLAGVVKIALGDPGGAVPLLAEAVKLRPRSWEALLNYSVALHDAGDAEEALVQSERTLALRSDVPEAHNSRGNALRALGRSEEALACYERALSLRFEYPDALSNRGAVLVDLGRSEEALSSCDQALALQPDFAQALFNRANALRNLGRHHRAIVNYEEALRLQPGYRDALTGKVAILTILHRDQEALAAAREATARDPVHVDALVALGVAAQRLGRLGEALAAFANALEVAPDHVVALRHTIAALRALGRPADALQGLDKLIEAKPGDVDALCERGQILRSLGRPVEALASFEEALAGVPTHAVALSNAALTALELCEWEKVGRFTDVIERPVAYDGMVVSPFVLLNVSNVPLLHHSGAKNFAGSIKASPLPPRPRAAGRHDKLRIAYVSGDFCDRPVGHQIAELIERHERERFEVYGVCFSPEDGSDIRARLLQAFDRYELVRGESDATAARCIRDLDVDIAIDLDGYMQNARPGILAARPAPIQVNYLGYPGTMGADFIDYVMADPVALPLREQPFVTEKIVHLPDCYRVYDTRSAIASPASRQAVGLPAKGFVFASFGDAFTITRAVFEVWMRLLGRVGGSVLWLRHGNDAACDRLRRIAAARDVDPSRLVFAARAPLPEHLGRHRVADLYLDTVPYNGHAAADALWASLPVLTCKGATFPGRIGASMLGAVGLPDLIAPDLAGYEALALRLATEPELLAGAKRRLEAQRTTAPLFDIDRLRRHIEAAYLRMDEMRSNDMSPQSFAVEAPAAPKGETKAEAENGAKVEQKAEAKVEPKAQITGEPRAGTKEETGGEPKPETKAETEAEPKPETKAETEAEPKPETKAETEAEPKIDTQAEPEAGPKTDAQAEAKAEPKTDAQAEPKVEPKAETK